MDYNEILRERMKDVIEGQEMTQAELAEKSGVSTGAISRYLSGVNKPKFEGIVKLAEALGVSIDYLVGFSSYKRVATKLPEDVSALLAAYERSDAHTKKMIWLQLEPYMTNKEKALAPHQSVELKNENEQVG